MTRSMYSDFIQLKEYFVKRLMREIDEGRVDRDIIDLLLAINRHPYLFTTSSCSGRIQLYSASLPGDKFNLINIVKWHRPPTYLSFKKYIYNSSMKNIWLAVVPPIFHISSINLLYAEKILKLAFLSGFKHSGIISISDSRVVVEIIGSERIEMPLKINNKILISEEDLHTVFNLCVKLLEKSKNKISRLKNSMGKMIYEFA